MPLKAAATMVAVTLALGAMPVASARNSGNSPQDVILDCEANGKLTRPHTQEALRTALKQLPADVKRYSTCERIIQQAIKPATKPATHHKCHKHHKRHKRHTCHKHHKRKHHHRKHRLRH
jgi:hypothetical protein